VRLLNPQSAIRDPQFLPAVLVDYAHTHDALENVLSALRPLTTGKLIVLFGCGGDRDKTKRPKMAKVACEWADRVIITSDNPRTEEAARIIEDILAGVPDGFRAGAGDRLTVEADRAKAIAMAVAHAGPDDVVLLAGKGHEDYQIIGKTKHHFDDREHAAAALARWTSRPAVSAA
jgi:UDP-N-acetylmuramoyl-L-alanyl-D-glutamate--2,6-diaminopimelate ligase